MKKKQLSLILSAVMLVSCVPGIHGFAEEKGVTGITAEVTSDYVGNIFFDKTQVELQVCFKNNDETATALDASYTITDGENRIIADGKFNDVTIAAGEEAEQTVSLGAMDYDTYKLNITAGGKKESYDFSSSVKSGSRNKDDVLGTCLHLNATSRKETVEPVKNLLMNAGINWIRDEYYWDQVEKEKGVYNFYTDYYVDELDGAGINKLLIFDYGNNLYGGAPHDEIGYKAYAAYCKTITEHLGDKIDAYEIWNEWNGGFGTTYGPEEYAYMFKYAAEAIKEAKPDAKIVACATSDVDLGWIKTVIEIAGIENMDAISIHPYAYPSSPESGGLKSNISRVHELAKSYGKDVDVWCTEIGYPASTGVIDETTAGAYKARIYIYGKTLSGNDKIFLYDFQNDGTSADNREHNFGMIKYFNPENINVPYAAKKGYLAIANATNILGDAEFVSVTPDDDNIQIYQFRKDNQGILSIWLLDGNGNVGVNVGCDTVTVTDWLGNSKTVKTTNGVVTVAASEKPVYISGSFDSYTVDNTIADFAENNLSVANGEDIVLTLKRNASFEGVSGTIDADLPSGFELKSAAEFGSDGDIDIVISTDNTVTNGSYKLAFNLNDADQSLGEVCATVNMVEETDIKVVPVLTNTEKFNSWRIDVSIKNNSRENNIEGKFSILEPEEYAGKTIDVPSLSFGESFTTSIDTELTPENKLIPLKIRFVSASGIEKEITRPVSCLAAVKANGEIEIDGVESENEWSDSMRFELDDLSNLKGRKSGYIYSGDGDLSGHGYLKWDDEAFYMLVKVKDDIHVQPSSGSGIWQGDGLQFCIDPSRGKGIGINDWHEIGIAYTNEGTTEMWKWLSIPGIAGGEVKDYTYKADRDEETNTVTYEAKIPWKQLIPMGTEIGADDIIGFCVIANEDDGEGRDGWIQFMDGIGAVKQAALFGDVILLNQAEGTVSDAQYPWADEAANALYKKGAVSIDYKGGDYVTKGEFAAMVIRALEKQDETFDIVPEGITEGCKYYNEICIANKLGIAFGAGEKYGAEDVISRQDMVTILERALDIETDADPVILKEFADYEQIADYAVQSFANLVSRGIIEGDDIGLNPLNGTTKAEAAAAVYRLVK